MTPRARGALSIALVVVSICLTQGVWWYILTRPPGTFHDQGGMAITFGLFPMTAVGWLAGGLPALILGARALSTAGSHNTAPPLGLLGIGLAVIARLLSLGTRLISS